MIDSDKIKEMGSVSKFLTITGQMIYIGRRDFSFVKPLYRSRTDHIKLVLYTKENCSLCDEAKDLIEEMYPDRFFIEEVDITKNNRELFRKFKLDIPVFYHEGKFLMQHKVDEKALEDLLASIGKNIKSG